MREKGIDRIRTLKPIFITHLIAMFIRAPDAKRRMRRDQVSSHNGLKLSETADALLEMSMTDSPALEHIPPRRSFAQYGIPTLQHPALISPFHHDNLHSIEEARFMLAHERYRIAMNRALPIRDSYLYAASSPLSLIAYNANTPSPFFVPTSAVPDLPFWVPPKFSGVRTLQLDVLCDNTCVETHARFELLQL